MAMARRLGLVLVLSVGVCFAPRGGLVAAVASDRDAAAVLSSYNVVVAGDEARSGHRRLRSGSGGKKREGVETDVEGSGTIYRYWEDFGDPPFVPGEDGGDRLCTYVFYVICGAGLLSILVIMSDPWWPPFEERSPGLMVMMCVSSMVWSWAALVVDNHAPEWMMLASVTAGGDGTGTAKFWLVWMRMVAGSGVFIGCLFVRLHAANALYVVKDVNEPIWWAVRLTKYVLPWAVLASLRIYFFATQMEAVLASSLSIGMGAAHMCFLIWLVASIDRNPERRREIGDIHVTMWWVLLMTVGPSCWHGFAIDYSVVSYATKISPDYDPVVDDPDPESVQTRQVISSLLTMGLLLMHWLLTMAPLIVRCLHKSSNLAWMEANYEGPFVEYRLKKLSPEERSRAGLVGRYEAAGDPTVSFNGDDEPVGDVVPPPISFCSRLLGSWRYEIEISEWSEADDTRSEKRTYRTLRKFVEEDEEVLTAEMCHWDVMQVDRDTELQATQLFRSLDLDGDGHLDRAEMRTALAKLHGGNSDETEVDQVMKDCDKDGDGFIDELEFVDWFRGSKAARELKKQVRKERKLQAAYSELGIAIGESGASHAIRALHVAVEADRITGHQGTDGETMERAWGAGGNLPGNP